MFSSSSVSPYFWALKPARSNLRIDARILRRFDILEDHDDCQGDSRGQQKGQHAEVVSK